MKNNDNICYIIPYSKLEGGAQYSVLDIIDVLLEYKEIKITIITLTELPNKYYKQKNIKIYYFKKELFDKFPYNILTIIQFIKFIRLIIKKEKISVLHYNFPGLLYFHFFIQKKGIRYIWTDRGEYENYNFINKLIFRVFLKKNILVTTTKNNYNKWKKFARQIYLIPNTVKISQKVKLKSKRDKLKLVQIGRIVRLKGYETSIKVVRELVFKHKLNAKLDIFGDVGTVRDDKVYYNTLVKLIKKYNIENNVSFKGHLNRERLLKILNEYDIMLQTSYIESFGRTIIEAFANGVCVISNNNNGAKSLIVDGYNGFLVSNNNITDYTRVILKINGDENLKEKIIKNAYKEIKEKYSRKVLRKYIKIFSQKLE